MTFEPKYPPFETRDRIKVWCDMQERAHFDVRQKLKSWFVSPDDAEQIISMLIEGNYLNEERFARAYASGKFRIKKWGWIKIENGLKQKHVSSYSISKAKEELEDEDILETLKSVLEKKAPFVKGKTKWERKQKLYRFAAGRGYSSDNIRNIIDEVLSGE